MSKKKTSTKTLRQQIREKAELRLDGLIEQVRDAVAKVLEDTTLDMDHVMGMCCKTQTSTLREQLVTRLANEAEADLMKLWNDQTNLSFGTEESDSAN